MDATTPKVRDSAVASVVDELHAMLISMEVVPGQPIRQEALAARLGVSRAPVREALGILHTEGVLEYTRNFGYSVKRFTLSELNQTYLIREALESVVLKGLPRFGRDSITALRGVNSKLAEAADRGNVAEMGALNREFHFLIFDASDLKLVVGEIKKMWNLTDAYRAFYLYDAGTRQRIIGEHEAMIEALESGDLRQLIILMDGHRGMVPQQLAGLLSGGLGGG